MFRSISKRVSIVTRVMLAGSLSLALFAAAMVFFIRNDLGRTVYAQTALRVGYANSVLHDLLKADGPPRLEGRSLRFGAWLANGDNSVVDHLRALTGADATIFMVVDGKPIRVATTILKLDGSGRNVGTELLGPARDAIDAGLGFSGISPVAGRDFVNRYDPIHDASGRTVGILYTGIPLTAMERAVSDAMGAVLVVTALALGACLAMLYVTMVPLRRALRNAVVIANGLAKGEVDQRSETISDGELGQMTDAFEDMIAYQQRMATIADALAAGDFTLEVVPASPRDRFGNAFANMSEKLKGLVGQLESSAMTDSLTQLGNRRAFDARMRTELSRAARRGGIVWLALVDVDNFKGVNDENGHQHGDLVLAELGGVLRRVRAEDSAYRLGGDEFALVMTDCSRDEASAALERLRESAQNELFGTTISVGFAGSTGVLDAEALIRQADAALYVCKLRGRNVVVNFDAARQFGDIPQQMNVAAVNRLIAEREVTIAFQPIWDLARGAILGFEALARPDIKSGLSGPQEAFDIAAKIRRTHDLDRVCRSAAIRAAVDLPGDALLFLNVAPESLVRGDLDPRLVSEELAAAAFPIDRVVLEITERYAGPSAPVIDAALELQRAGFRVALDDTGAGNAGLEYLSRMRFDFIKIDGSIVAKAADDVAARGVVTAIVSLAKTTGAYVIAEGIEDRRMLDAVRPIDGAQGYFLGRPGSIDAPSTAGARDLSREGTLVSRTSR
jgi:diguanylate cyclase (GGDEF)-like protein